MQTQDYDWYCTYKFCLELDREYLGNNVGIFWIKFNDDRTRFSITADVDECCNLGIPIFKNIRIFSNISSEQKLNTIHQLLKGQGVPKTLRHFALIEAKKKNE